ncbi:MAG TPA: hypothetical protein VFZ73_03355 [Gemmatimonadaceae bacterium]
MRRGIALGILFLGPIAAEAQGRGAPPEAARARAALAPLAALVGEWEGEARVMTGPGETINVRQFEYVTFGAGSTVLMIRGIGREPEPPGKGEIVYEAAAMLWFDGESGKLRMRAHRAEGIAVEPDIELRPDTLIWGFPVPGGRIRYTIAYTNTSWHEVGHFLREGSPPIPTVDMRLRRVK